MLTVTVSWLPRKLSLMLILPSTIGCIFSISRGMWDKLAIYPTCLPQNIERILLDGDVQSLSYVNVIIRQPIGYHDSLHGDAISVGNRVEGIARLHHMGGRLRR